jgi:hypothetical protein
VENSVFAPLLLRLWMIFPLLNHCRQSRLFIKDAIQSPPSSTYFNWKRVWQGMSEKSVPHALRLLNGEPIHETDACRQRAISDNSSLENLGESCEGALLHQPQRLGQHSVCPLGCKMETRIRYQTLVFYQSQPTLGVNLFQDRHQLRACQWRRLDQVCRVYARGQGGLH